MIYIMFKINFKKIAKIESRDILKKINKFKI